MAVDRLVITKQGQFKKDFTQEEKDRQLVEQMKVTYTYPQITEEQEMLALLVIENEELKIRITKLENGGTL